MSHLRQEQLSALLDGALDDRDRDRANAHLAECAECRDELAALAESDRMLAVSLDHEPGEAYFDQFADRVLRRIATTAPREVARPQSFWEKLTTPRGLAWAGGVVALLVAAGLGWIGWQDSRSPLPGSAAIGRAERQAARAATPQRSATVPDDTKNKSFRAKENVAGGAKTPKPEPANGLRDERTFAAVPPASKTEPYQYQSEGALKRSAAPQQEKDGPSAAGRADEAKLQAAPQNQAAPSQRQQAVRKTESGEELPVRSRAPAPAPAPAPAAQPAPVDKVGNRVEAETQVLKQRSASPLQKALDSAAKSSQSTVQGFAATPPAEVSAPGATLEREAGATSNARIPGLERPSRPNPARWSEALWPLVARADRYERLANAVGSAANFDSAAVQWERVLAQAPVGPLRVEASHHIAWSRAQSFAIAPTFASRSNARVATERYLEVAPPGLDRERYRQLLGTLR